MKLINNLFSKKKTCIIAEKYSVALDYSRALNCAKKDNRFENNEYVIVWTDGHICTLYDPEDYDKKYNKWNLGDLPIDPNGFWIKVRGGKEKRLKEIKEIIEREDIKKICIATDSAREGNLIGEYLLRVINNKKPEFRAMINSYKKSDIIKGIKEMQALSSDEVKNMTLAAQARDEIDWLVGTNLSRLYSVLYKRQYYVGRCKTVILNLICKREDEINSAEQKIYYTITNNFKSLDGYEYTGLLQADISDESQANKIKDELENKEGNITNIIKEIKNVAPPQLLNLNDLIIVCSNRFGYAAEETYVLAQKLYEEFKLISYARTDSRHIKKSMMEDIKDTLNVLNNKKIQMTNPNSFKLFEARCVDDEKVIEHTAIIPLKVENLDSIYKELSIKEKNMYGIIVDNFVSNFLEDYIYESFCVETTVNKYKFITHIKNTLNNGWRGEINKDNENKLTLKENNIVKSNEILIEKKLSKLPERYIDGDLFSILDNPARFVKDKVFKDILKNQGIGTNATRALLLKDLIKHRYVTREKKYLIPTTDGLDLIRDVKTNNLKDPVFTAEVEKKLQDIQNGKLSKDIVINDIRNFIKQHVNELKVEAKNNEKEKKVYGICPKCKEGKIVNAAEKGYGCTNLKIKGCRFFISKYILGTEIGRDQVENILTNGETDVMQFNGKDGTFSAKIILDKQSNTKFSRG
ncbi:DNA topoisomerase [Clostridium saccharoperbutylacetonicum]|uniref:type IA DNA topoisomerase n=1 Tax=Clostridium saccharoperbutylacetonicum TaxID=36745 RepID=UPI0039EC0B34